MKPIVVIFAEDAMTCRLNWYSITRGTSDGGEILAAFELYLVRSHSSQEIIGLVCIVR